MQKLYLLSGMMILGAIASINTMEPERRPEIYEMMDSAIGENLGEVRWPAVFALLNSMRGIINVNEYRDNNGDTLLETAVDSRNFVATKELLEKYNANPNLIGDLGRTVLRRFIEGFDTNRRGIKPGDLTIIKLLLTYGANPNIKGRDGKDCIWVAKKLQQKGYSLSSELLQILEPYKK
jgi:hypothetical protein